MSSDPSSSLSSQSIIGFLDELESKAPTPGGGASAAMTGAIAASTAGMVLSYSVHKKSLVEHRETNIQAQTQLRNAKEIFLTLGDEDAQGYGELNALWKLDKDDPVRIEKWDGAVLSAITPPRAMLALSLEILRVCQSLITTTNRQLKSDLGVAAVLAQASARSAAWNVRINIPLLQEDQQDSVAQETQSLIDQAQEICIDIEKGCS